MLKTVDNVVVALCADYDRRRLAIEGRVYPRRIDTELRYYNFKIFDAAAEIVGASAAEGFIREIGERRGFAHSDVIAYGESSYKHYKGLVRANIAKALYLID